MNARNDTARRPSLGSLWTGRLAVALAIWATSVPALVPAVPAAVSAYAETGTRSSPAAAEAGIDTTIKPGDDFYAYANGAWLQRTAIPEGADRWGARNEIEDRASRQLSEAVAQAATAPSGTYARKVADFYAAWLADSMIEAKGLAPIQPLLQLIEGVNDRETLARLIGSDVRADVDPMNFGIYASSHLFGVAVERGIHGEQTHFLYLVQGGLGLPDRNYYFDSSPRMQNLKSAYQSYVAQVMELAGFEPGLQRAEAIVALETAIAQIHATVEESSNDRNADNHWSRGDFSNNAPGIEWSAFFAAAGITKQDALVVWQPSAIKGEAALVGSYSLAVWRDYLRFHLIDRYAEVLPQRFAKLSSQMRHLVKGDAEHDAPTRRSRERRALQATGNALPDAVGRLYVDRYFPSETRARVQKIAANVIDSFARRVEAAQWMAPTTRSEALSKLTTMYFGVGYPDTWPDLSRLKIDATDPIGNLQRATDWSYRNALANLEKPTDRREWVISPQTVGACSIPPQNAYNFAAALLQVPKFDPTASDAANYGSIGAIFGHEISHFVDRLGADYDAQGRMHHWWTEADATRFAALEQPLVSQFSNYHPFPDVAINGKLSLTENIADLGGLAAAFDAYRRTLGERVNDKDFVRQQDRQFFIAFARAWRIKIGDDALRAQATNSDHAPERYRVLTVRNIDAWYDAFAVTPGQRLYLAPSARVRIW